MWVRKPPPVVIVPPVGIAMHAPLEQNGVPALHVLPQLPQLFGSEPMATSQPVATMPSQLAKPAAQVAMPQTLLAQKLVALATPGHDVQLPQ